MDEDERSLMPLFGELTKSNFQDRATREETAERQRQELRRLEQRDEAIREAILLRDPLNESLLPNPSD